MDVSIIIVNYRTPDMVINCIHSIEDITTEVDYEIIVVDNNSQDGSVEKLKTVLGSKAKVVVSETNLGFGKGNNLGANCASGRFLFFLNPDTILLNNAIGLLAHYLDKHPEAGVAGGNLYFPDRTPAPSFCRSFNDPAAEKDRASWKTIIGNIIKNRIQSREGIPEFNNNGKIEQVAYVFGADLMIRRGLFIDINGFDPDFFMYGEEAELCWRVHQKGFQIVSIPEAEIIHFEGASTGGAKGFNENQFRLRMGGTFTYFYKCFGLDGAKDFFRMRSKQYRRLAILGKIRGRKLDDYGPFRQYKILNEVYQDFIEKQECE